jgi:cell division protein FtsB
MRELESKQKIRRWVYSTPVLVLLLALLFILFRGTLGIWEKERESASRVEDLTGKMAEVTMRTQELESSLTRLSTDEGIRDEIREKFDVSAEGEYMVVIVDPRAETATSTEEIQAWYRRLWNAIMKQ